MTKRLRCLVGRHHWYTVAGAGDAADCWDCGKHRGSKREPVHRSTMSRHDAGRARVEAFAKSDVGQFWGHGGG